MHNLQYNRYKLKTVWIGILFAILAGCAAGDAFNLNSPDISLSNIAPAEVNLFEQQYEVSLRVQNPNDIILRASGLNFKVFLNDREFARGVSNKDFIVPALGEFIIKIKVASSTLDWIRQINDLSSSNGEKGLSYKLEGALFLGGHIRKKIGFSRSGNILPDDQKQ